MVVLGEYGSAGRREPLCAPPIPGKQAAGARTVRTRIATDLHDDIGSTLSQISVLSEVVCQRVGGDTHLSTIAGLSRSLIDSLNDIVWAINPNRDSLSDLIQRMRRFANDFVTSRPLQLTLR